MAHEIDLAGNRYSLGRLNAMQQFHVSRRIAPIVPTLIPVFLRVRASGKPLTDDLEGLAAALQPLADGLAALKDEDAEYVFGTCLSVVQRQQQTGWARVWSGSQTMFEDMDLAVTLPLVVQVITANLGPFINGLLTSQASSPAAAAARAG
ncbi:phage tail assembly chaperone [Cupriavidus alkaliphilus]|uniref:Bacteriophage protein n=1 Tax=Cupriavidus alkaliphilus TaxID=942866 RepID=A0A7W4V6P0_9BURK|nr:hypothetical protein [Cupriavidus alkaliphilus]MBB3006041.1 hypothetical protein [Cupriavidus alkaliphilus]SCB10295.1 hypothetical protein GA0116996_101653 [Cupriavidus alkaliphilus]